eukprot:754905-Hanusia_phi.AAC.2
MSKAVKTMFVFPIPRHSVDRSCFNQHLTVELRTFTCRKYTLEPSQSPAELHDSEKSLEACLASWMILRSMISALFSCETFSKQIGGGSGGGGDGNDDDDDDSDDHRHNNSVKVAACRVGGDSACDGVEDDGDDGDTKDVNYQQQSWDEEDESVEVGRAAQKHDR